MSKFLLVVFSAIALNCSVFSNPCLADEHASIIVENSYARESIPGTTISSAYMTLNNTSSVNVKLIAASSSVSERIEIHQHTMKNGLMKMRQRDNVEIVANEHVVFQPSGFHLMIFDLKKPLKADSSIIITLHFDDKSSVDVNYLVKGLKQKKQHHHHH